MRTLLRMIIASVVCLLAQLAVAEDAAEKAELEKFKGTWVFESVTVNGQKETPPQGAELMIDGNIMTITVVEPEAKEPKGSNVPPKTSTRRKATIKLKFDANPKQIDIADEQDGRIERTELGIYQFDGGKLKMCMGGERPKVDVDTRPKAFDDKLGPLIILTRKAK